MIEFATPIGPIIAAKLFGGGGSADVTAAAVAAAISGMTAAQKAGVRTDIDAEPAKLIVTVTESSGTYAANKTFSQMWTAYNTDHKTVTVAMGDTEFVLSSADPSGMAFTSLSVGSGNAALSMLTVDENDDWNYAEFAAEQKPTAVTVTGTTPSIAAAANTIYNCGELASLTVSSFPASGKFWIWFTSGATPTTTVGISNFVTEANKKYRIFVENGYATYDSWAIS